MIIDTTGKLLTPGKNGKDCLGNGNYRDFSGKAIECCCDECDYYMCCIENSEEDCKSCDNKECPNAL